MYIKLKEPSEKIAGIVDGKFLSYGNVKGRLIIKHGYVIDPRNNIEANLDIAIEDNQIIEVSEDISAEREDRIIDAEKLLVVPGLIDIHLHMGDLFDVDTASVRHAVQDGVTTALSPGAGNTFMAPALLGAEMDRGLPLNVGVFLGAANILATSLTDEEIVQLFTGKLPWEAACNRLTRNALVNRTAPLIVGIKDHMGHFIMPNENIRRIFEICSKAKLMYMSHTQDPAHAEKMVQLSEGAQLHLTHATAAGTGTHGEAKESMERVVELCRCENVTGDFVTTMLRRGLGSREGLQMDVRARQVCLDALHNNLINVLVSDGQNQSVMKGFGDTRDNIPALLELVDEGVLSISQAIATMTKNSAKLLSMKTRSDWWQEKMGHLGVGALANVTIIDPYDKLATYTIVNGKVAAFENRLLRNVGNAGSWVSRFGSLNKMGIGDLGIFV